MGLFTLYKNKKGYWQFGHNKISDILIGALLICICIPLWITMLIFHGWYLSVVWVNNFIDKIKITRG